MDRDRLQEEIAKWEREIADLEEQLAKKREEKAKIERQAISGQSRRDKLKSRDRDIQSLTDRIKHAEEKKTEAEEALQSLESTRVEMDAEMIEDALERDTSSDDIRPVEVRDKSSEELRAEADGLLDQAIDLEDDNAFASEAALDIGIQTEEEAVRKENEANANSQVTALSVVPALDREPEEEMASEKTPDELRKEAEDLLDVAVDIIDRNETAGEAVFDKAVDVADEAIRREKQTTDEKATESGETDNTEEEVEEINESEDVEETVETTEETADNSSVVEESEEVEEDREEVEENQEDRVAAITSSDMEYKNMIDKRLAKIRTKILGLKLKEANDFTGHTLNLIRGYEAELEKLQEISDAIGSRNELNSAAEVGLSFLDNRRAKNHEKQDFYRNQIEQLKKMKGNLISARAKFKADKKVIKLNKKIQRMQKRDCFCGKIQRSIMYPKFLYESRKRAILSKAEGRVQAYEDKLHDNNLMNQELVAMSKDNLITDIRERFYDIKGVYYQKRLDRSRAILEEMQQKKGIIAMRGARITSLSKGYLDKIRQKREAEAQMGMAAGMTA